MYKKFLMLFFVFIFSFGTNMGHAGDAKKGKKLLKDVLLAITWPLEQSIKLVQTFGKFTVPRLLCKTTINTPIGLKPQELFGTTKN